MEINAYVFEIITLLMATFFFFVVMRLFDVVSKRPKQLMVLVLLPLITAAAAWWLASIYLLFAYIALLIMPVGLVVAYRITLAKAVAVTIVWAGAMAVFLKFAWPYLQ